MLIITLWGRYYYSPHVTDEEIEAQMFSNLPKEIHQRSGKARMPTQEGPPAVRLTPPILANAWHHKAFWCANLSSPLSTTMTRASWTVAPPTFVYPRKCSKLLSNPSRQPPRSVGLRTGIQEMTVSRGAQSSTRAKTPTLRPLYLDHLKGVLCYGPQSVGTQSPWSV